MLQKRNKSIVAKTSSVLLVMVTLFSASSNAVAGPKPSPSPSSSYQVLHVFSNASDGQTPMACVQTNAAGQLFGSTEFGGAHGFGSIFMLQPPPSGTTSWTGKDTFSS